MRHRVLFDDFFHAKNSNFCISSIFFEMKSNELPQLLEIREEQLILVEEQTPEVLRQIQ